MGELLQNFMTTLTASVESLYNLAWALSLVCASRLRSRWCGCSAP